MSVADLIQWARTAQKSGELTFRDFTKRKIDVVFLDGRIVYSATDSSRATYSAYLVHLGLCTPEDVEWALQRERETGMMVGAVLVQGGRLAETLAATTLTQKTIEDLCDVFLWPDGAFEFRPEPLRGRRFLPIDLDPIRIVDEGLRRQDIWNRLQATIHPEKVFEPTGKALDPKAKWDDVVIARRVLELVDGSLATSEIVKASPFSRYKIVLALSELRAAGLIRSEDQTELGQREIRIRNRLAAAQTARDGGRWSEAVQILEGLVAAHPGRAELARELMETLEGFRASVYNHNFGVRDVPVIAIGPDAVTHLELDRETGYLLSRIDGRTPVSEILRILPIEEVEALRILKRLLEARVIDFPNRAG